MNIGIVTTWFERGAAYVSRQFMEELQKTDNVFIYARGGEKYANDDPNWNLENVYWGKQNIIYKQTTYIEKKDFIKWLENKSIDIVLFNEQLWFEPIFWCKKLNIRTISYIDYYTEETIPFFNIFDALICNTKRHAFAFRNHKNINYIKWGTNLNLYKPTNKDNDILTFFHSAGMAPYRKGTDIVLKSFYSAKNHNRAKLLLHTQVPLDKLLPNHKYIIDSLISEGTLEIVEETITAPGLYHKGDIYIYPSRLDGIGLSLMEAISTGMACISINNGPMNEFIEPTFGHLCDVDYFYSRKDGYYWPMAEPSVISLTNLIESYIDGKYDISTMKKEARLYAEKELNFSNNCIPLHDIFEKTTLSNINNDLTKIITIYDKKSLYKYMKSLFHLQVAILKVKNYIKLLLN